ncbi:nucleolar DEAD-box protein required for synthesis of 60S ribosomal subunit [Geranomyces variabilis]|uniref:RNA helicase n=1 Tax=Geranomyces variabilis TaxID=109894 RepID=A0AAD5THB5_9FUNG|nr:nucleolar DEAD-box protein required for synthesis of 60S ribosomal subunit [Geranomyces variabilis]
MAKAQKKLQQKQKPKPAAANAASAKGKRTAAAAAALTAAKSAATADSTLPPAPDRPAFDPLLISTLEDEDDVPQFGQPDDEDDEDDEDDDEEQDTANGAISNGKISRDMDADADFDEVVFGDADPFQAVLGKIAAPFGSVHLAKAKDEEAEAEEDTDDEDEAAEPEGDVSDVDDDEVFGAAEDEVDGEGEGDDDDQDEVTTTKSRPSSRRDAVQDAQDEADAEAAEAADVVHQKRKAEYFAAAPAVEDPTAMDSFNGMRLSRPILKGIAAMGFVKPTAIQSRTIPIAMQGTDICASAVTGSGKTGAFIIPVLERLLFRPKNVATTRVLVLVPTRELGVQCHAVAVSLAKFSDIQFCLCVGGLSSKTQELELRKRPDVVIATPGRLIDHIHNSRSFNLDAVEILIMDEADRMLEDGFTAELNEIIKHTPKSRQTMLFSATMTDNVDDLIKLSLNRPVRLFVDSSSSIASRLIQEFIRVRSHREEQRPAILAALCTRTYKAQTIIFFRSKAAAHHMRIVFTLLGLKAAELHGNLTQAQRLEALEMFREQKVDFLLATDLASRGLDINGIKTVINYDMPKNYAQYVHRIGRTARAGAAGRAVSLVGEADRNVLKMAIKNSRDEVKHRVVPASVVTKYEAKVAALETDVKATYAQEAHDKDVRIAEMQVTRMRNMILHEDEIKSRPAKTWFLNQKEVAAEKEKGLAVHNAKFGDDSNKRKAEDGPKRTPFDGLSRKQKRTKIAREEDAKEIAAMARHARSAKAKARPQRLNAEPPARTAPQASASKPKKKASESVGFNAELTNTNKKQIASVRKAPKPLPGKREKEEKKGGSDRRLGKLKSVKSFKSKAKHKRR